MKSSGVTLKYIPQVLCHKIPKAHILKSNKGYIPKKVIQKDIDRSTSDITLCLVLNDTYKTLSIILDKYMDMDMDINLVLCVNRPFQYGELSKISKLCGKFHKHKIIHNKEKFFTSEGSVKNYITKIAYDTYKTTYIIVSDDDVLPNIESLKLLMLMMNTLDYNSYGITSINTEVGESVVSIRNNKITSASPVSGFQPATLVNGRCMVIRRDVFDSCQFDEECHNSKLLAWNLCCCARKNGWEMGMLHKPLIYNDTESIYIKKVDIKANIESYKLFVSKWGIHPEISTFLNKHLRSEKDYMEPSKKDEIRYSIIIPYKAIDDREKLFRASIESIYKHTNNIDNIEIVVHETAPERTISDDFIKKYNLVYGFSEWNKVFHRSWNLNTASKHLATGDVLVHCDADVIINRGWVDELLKCDRSTVKIGWRKMINLNEKGTEIYLNTGKIDKHHIERERRFGLLGAGGGINVFNREDFFKIKGWPEEYDKGYGGPDNSLIYKIKNILNIPYTSLNACVYHLHHNHKTMKGDNRFSILARHKTMSKKQWAAYIKGKVIGKKVANMVIIRNDR